MREEKRDEKIAFAITIIFTEYFLLSTQHFSCIFSLSLLSLFSPLSFLSFILYSYSVLFSPLHFHPKRQSQILIFRSVHILPAFMKFCVFVSFALLLFFFSLPSLSTLLFFSSTLPFFECVSMNIIITIFFFHFSHHHIYKN